MIVALLFMAIDFVAWRLHRARCLYCYDEVIDHAHDKPKTCVEGFDLWLRAKPKKIKPRAPFFRC